MKLRHISKIDKGDTQYRIGDDVHREDGPNIHHDMEYFDLGGETIFSRPLTK